MLLHEELCIPHVPPDVRIIEIRLEHSENKLHADQCQREYGDEGRSSPDPAEKARSEIPQIVPVYSGGCNG